MAEDVLITPTREIEKELSFPQWLAKVNERVTLSLRCMKEKVDKIQESDYDILKALHGIWFFGEAPLYTTITIPDTRQSKQGELFHTDKTSEDSDSSVTFDSERDKILDGKEIAEVEKKPTKSKKNGNKKI